MKWQYYSFVVNILNTGFTANSSASNIWDTHKSHNVLDEKNASVYTEELGEKGWELISITPIATDSSSPNTRQLLYYFKKQME